MCVCVCVCVGREHIRHIIRASYQYIYIYIYNVLIENFTRHVFG